MVPLGEFVLLYLLTKEENTRKAFGYFFDLLAHDLLYCKTNKSKMSLGMVLVSEPGMNI